MRHTLFFILIMLTGSSATALADWTLDNAHSRLSFVSTKAGTVAEVHRFEEMKGWLGDDGRFRLVIDMASVETAIAIRNERMRELLFETERYPEAVLSAQIDLAPLRELAVGEQTELVAEAELSVKERTTGVTVQASIARLADGVLLVTSTQPIVVDANTLGLADGVEKLRSLAGLPAISPAVPVNFQLTLREDPEPVSRVSQR
jgi:polyisoprenoid-binding protein YceI